MSQDAAGYLIGIGAIAALVIVEICRFAWEHIGDE